MERSVEASTTIGVVDARVREVLLDDPVVMFRETRVVDDSRAEIGRASCRERV